LILGDEFFPVSKFQKLYSFLPLLVFDIEVASVVNHSDNQN